MTVDPARIQRIGEAAQDFARAYGDFEWHLRAFAEFCEVASGLDRYAESRAARGDSADTCINCGAELTRFREAALGLGRHERSDR